MARCYSAFKIDPPKIEVMVCLLWVWSGRWGMLIVETIGRIRREHFVKAKTIKEIARALNLSRNTVRKVLRSGATSFEYEREVQPRPKLGRWRADLDGLLMANAAKTGRERLTLIRIFEELHGRGYDGGYDAVRRYARRWNREHAATTADAYVPLSFAPGEAYQFDWSHEVVLLSGVTVTVKVAHVRLCHSRMLFVRAYPRETQEMEHPADRTHRHGVARRRHHDPRPRPRPCLAAAAPPHHPKRRLLRQPHHADLRHAGADRGLIGTADPRGQLGVQYATV